VQVRVGVCLSQLELCAIKHVYSQRSLLTFRSDNDLVAATTDPHTITDACRSVDRAKVHYSQGPL